MLGARKGGRTHRTQMFGTVRVFSPCVGPTEKRVHPLALLPEVAYNYTGVGLGGLIGTSLSCLSCQNLAT